MFDLAFFIRLLPIFCGALLKQEDTILASGYFLSSQLKALQPKKLQLTGQTNGGRRTVLSPVLRWVANYKEIKDLG